jgi:hypothetical protein
VLAYFADISPRRSLAEITLMPRTVPSARRGHKQPNSAMSVINLHQHTALPLVPTRHARMSARQTGNDMDRRFENSLADFTVMEHSC